MRSFSLFLFIIACCAPFWAGAQESASPPATLAVITLSAGGKTLAAEIADTPAARRLGLSHRAHLPPGRGMLLVFLEPRRACLWMREVNFPLEAAFIDAAGKIISIARMQARTENLHCAPSAAKYALEANAGFFQDAKIGGIVLGLPPP